MDWDCLALLKERFSEYCRSFYCENEQDQRNIILKEEHTFRVCSNMSALCDSLDLGNGDRALAEAVALLHDIGRFPQYRDYGTFKDSESINHGGLGATILRDSAILDGITAEDRTLIIRSVALHNAYRLPRDLEPRLADFVRLIRDADKLDIWQVFLDYYAMPEGERASAVGLGFPDTPGCSSTVLSTLASGAMVDLATVTSLNDFKLLQLSWIYDLNYPTARHMTLERNYIEAIAATMTGVGNLDGLLDQLLSFLRSNSARS